MWRYEMGGLGALQCLRVRALDQHRTGKEPPCLSDHYFSMEYLKRAGQQMRDGRPLVFLEEQVNLVAKDIEKQQYFLLNFSLENQSIPCMKCGKRFPTDEEKETVLCPKCTLEE